MSSSPSPVQFKDANRSFEICQLVGLSLGFLVYGLYVCLFIVSLMIMYQRRKTSGSTFSSKVFFTTTSIIFILVTFDEALNLYRVVRAYVFSPDPFLYFFHTAQWENFLHNLNIVVVTVIADSLVVYRCFIVWSRNWWAILIPMALLLTQIGISIPVFVAYQNPALFHTPAFIRLLNTVYPLVFAQNVITTGLIAFRIWRRHRLSKAAGIRNMGASMFYIARIIIESAALYTIELFVLIVMFALSSNGFWLVNALTVPTIGIVFSLIAVRVHLSQVNAPSQPPTGILPTFAQWTATPLTDEFDSMTSTNTDAGRQSTPSIPQIKSMKSQPESGDVV